MYIHEAISATDSICPYITRAAWVRITSEPCGAAVKIQPTTSPDGCIVESVLEEIPSRRWEPTAEDLVANDWMITS